jgi:hydroxypyruvate isomerase
VRFSANLSFLYPGVPLVDAIAAAAEAGFAGVEYASPYDDDPQVLAAALTRHALSQVLFNCPMGDAATGDRGYAADPSRTPEFEAGIERAAQTAVALGCTRINCLTGAAPPGVGAATARATVCANLSFAARRFARDGITLLVEHLNSIDTPGFFIDSPAKAFAIVAELALPNVRVQYDVYHAQLSQGNIIATLRAHLDRIGHIQISDAPGRSVPGSGELAYDRILREIDTLGYDGWVGLEYRPPAGGDRFGWIERYGFSRRSR